MLGHHPVNLGLRFVLEIAALIAMGVGGYNVAPGLVGWLIGIGLPVVAAVCWGVFNVPGDASRSGQAPVPVTGVVRLSLEIAFFLVATLLIAPVSAMAATLLAVAVVLHYLLSIDRIRWLIAH